MAEEALQVAMGVALGGALQDRPRDEELEAFALGFAALVP